jgi:tetratricopeptide (TPR) repeat protein
VRAGLLAQALAAQGRAGEAERFLQIADETASQDDVASQGLIRAVRARLLARRGEFAEAERLVQEALALDAGV